MDTSSGPTSDFKFMQWVKSPEDELDLAELKKAVPAETASSYELKIGSATDKAALLFLRQQIQEHKSTLQTKDPQVIQKLARACDQLRKNIEGTHYTGRNIFKKAVAAYESFKVERQIQKTNADIFSLQKQKLLDRLTFVSGPDPELCQLIATALPHLKRDEQIQALTHLMSTTFFNELLKTPDLGNREPALQQIFKSLYTNGLLYQAVNGAAGPYGSLEHSFSADAKACFKTILKEQMLESLQKPRFSIKTQVTNVANLPSSIKILPSTRETVHPEVAKFLDSQIADVALEVMEEPIGVDRNPHNRSPALNAVHDLLKDTILRRIAADKDEVIKITIPNIYPDSQKQPLLFNSAVDHAKERIRKAYDYQSRALNAVTEQDLPQKTAFLAELAKIKSILDTFPEDPRQQAALLILLSITSADRVAIKEDTLKPAFDRLQTRFERVRTLLEPSQVSEIEKNLQPPYKVAKYEKIQPLLSGIEMNNPQGHVQHKVLLIDAAKELIRYKGIASDATLYTNPKFLDLSQRLRDILPQKEQKISPQELDIIYKEITQTLLTIKESDPAAFENVLKQFPQTWLSLLQMDSSLVSDIAVSPLPKTAPIRTYIDHLEFFLTTKPSPLYNVIYWELVQDAKMDIHSEKSQNLLSIVQKMMVDELIQLNQQDLPKCRALLFNPNATPIKQMFGFVQPELLTEIELTRISDELNEKESFLSTSIRLAAEDHRYSDANQTLESYLQTFKDIKQADTFLDEHRPIVDYFLRVKPEVLSGTKYGPKKT